MLGTYGVYAYQDGELSTVVDLSDTYLYRYNQERPEDETEASVWEKAISVIFTDGQTLYGLQPYSGQIFQLTEGKLESYTQLPEDLLYVQSDDFYREIKGTAMTTENCSCCLERITTMNMIKPSLQSLTSPRKT